MKKHRFPARGFMHAAAALALLGALWVAAPVVQADTDITVNTTEEPPVTNGNCSLREAANAANYDIATDGCAKGTGTDTIKFNIGASGSQQTITLLSVLQFNAPVILDGATQPGYAGTPLIHITGAIPTLVSFYGHSGSIIRGLQFSQTDGSANPALMLTGDNYQVKGCYFQTDGSAHLSASNGGIYLSGQNGTIGGTLAADRNVFGARGPILVAGGSGGNTIQGNYFGVQTDGSTALTGSHDYGNAIDLLAGSNNTVRGNVIGGYGAGINLQYPTQSNTIAGNHIGVGADGSTPIRNQAGILVQGSSGNTIGGTVAADRNIISGNTTANIYLVAGPAASVPDSNTIQANYIGTTADGLAAVAPQGYGIYIVSGSDTVIGTVPYFNVISGNTEGVLIGAGVTGTIIRNNAIGTDPGGSLSVPNDNRGIHSLSAVNIGSATTPGYNSIAGNGSGAGIELTNSSGSTVYQNGIGVSDIGASMGFAVGVLLDNSSALIGSNNIRYNTLGGVYLLATSTIEPGSTMNCVQGNGNYGVNSLNTGASAPFTQNWWGSPTGPYNPTTNPGGLGAAVSDYVDYDPYLAAAPPACAAEEPPPAIVSIFPGYLGTSCLTPKVGVTLLLDSSLRLPSGDFNPAGVTLWLDEVNQTSQAQIAQTGSKPATHASILYTPPSDLSLGWHSAMFVFPSSGGPVQYNWPFTVLNSPCSTSAPLEEPLGDALGGEAPGEPSADSLASASAEAGEGITAPGDTEASSLAAADSTESTVAPLAPVTTAEAAGAWRYLPHPGLFSMLLGLRP
jgi:CSLREA domain-containing protein